MQVIELESKEDVDFLNVTEAVPKIVAEGGVSSGICNLFVPHTTVGITINSAIDYETPTDIINELNYLIPKRTDYVHQFDSPQDAAGHIKTSVIGSSLTIPIDGGKLAMSGSQSILFCEFDGPRHRKLHVTLVSAR